jgi:hypothetical protein
MANRNNNINTTKEATAQALTDDKSMLEDRYEQFPGHVIDLAAAAGMPIEPHLRQLNRIQLLCAGMGTVMRIVSGNQVMAACFDPQDDGTAIPLSVVAIDQLTNMVATMCEGISEEIAASADALRALVSA